MATIVRAKKHLGQHFLADKSTAKKIVDALNVDGTYDTVLEVGPGMGVLSDFLVPQTAYRTYLLDIDTESIVFLKQKYAAYAEQVIEGDFLAFDFKSITPGACAVIGNFPYNISSQIVFKILDNRNTVPQMVGMFQKEVAERIAAQKDSKIYGILSVLVQAFYTVEYLLTVKPGAFNPPPKVNSAVIRLQRNAVPQLPCDEALFIKVVKAAFNQRRKTVRNSISSFVQPHHQLDEQMLQKRAENLSVADFIQLTLQLQGYAK